MASPSSTVSGGDGDTPPVSSSNTPVAVSGTTSVGAVSGSTAVAVSGTASVGAASGFTAVAISGTTSGSTAVAVSGTPTFAVTGSTAAAVSGSIAAASGTTASAAPAPAPAPAPPQAPAPAPPQAPAPLQHRKAPADPKPGSRARLSRALEKVTLDNIKEANAGIKRARKTEAKREENFKKQKHDDNMSEDEGDYPDSRTDTSDAGSSD